MPSPKTKTKTSKARSIRAARGDLPVVSAAEKRRAGRIYRKLAEAYPDATCALRHDGPWQLLIATILSAQCTDTRVNIVSPELFAAYPGPADLAAARPRDVKKLIKSTGFYHNKTKFIQGASRKIVETHGGHVPDTMDELLALPGVARKTANVVLGNAFDKSCGVVVDTHVARLGRRLGLSGEKEPEKIERDLMARFPRRRWIMLAHVLIFHGRRLCKARSPICSQCLLNRTCPKVGVENAK